MKIKVVQISDNKKGLYRPPHPSHWYVDHINEFFVVTEKSSRGIEMYKVISGEAKNKFIDPLDCTIVCENIERPNIVCLCGSTKFYKEFIEANYRETMKGSIVLTVGSFGHSSPEAHGRRIMYTESEKIKLDQLHFKKIELADEILIINVDGYIGHSTYGEIDYAMSLNKGIRWLYPHLIPAKYV